MNKTFEYTYGDVKEIGNYTIQSNWPINAVLSSGTYGYEVTITSAIGCSDDNRPITKLSAEFNIVDRDKFNIIFMSLDQSIINLAESIKCYSDRPQLAAKYIGKIMISNMNFDDLLNIVAILNCGSFECGQDFIKNTIKDIIKIKPASQKEETIG